MTISKPISTKWAFHICGPISEEQTCREFGVTRIHVNCPWAHIDFPYWPTSRWPNVDLTKKFDFS